MGLFKESGVILIKTTPSGHECVCVCVCVCLNQSKEDVKAGTVCLSVCALVQVSLLFEGQCFLLGLSIDSKWIHLIMPINLLQLWLFAWKSLFCSPRLHLFYKNTVKSVILWNIITMWNTCVLFEYIFKYNLLFECKSEFLASSLLSSVSHDPSEIILICWFAAQYLLLLLL